MRTFTQAFALVLLTILFGSTGGAYGDEKKDVYPGESWAKMKSPEASGWSTDGLAAARAFAEEIGSTAVMVVQHGFVVDAWGEIATKSNLHSVRKSLLSALIGIAVDKGQINLSETLADLRIEDNEPALTPVEKQATVGDLIKARSGIYHPALYETRRMTASKPKRGSHAPGTSWHYNNWDFNTLGTIYEQQTGEKIFEAFKSKIADPLQMQDFEVDDGRYVTGKKSNHAAYPFRMTARDLARFGLLYLRKGRWSGGQIISSAWVAESTTSHSETTRGPGYGYMWWTGSGDKVFPNVNIPEHIYYAAGNHRQYLFVFPHLDLVVVHRVNSDWFQIVPAKRQVGRLLWMILHAAGETEIGPDPSIEKSAGKRLTSEGIRRDVIGSAITGTNSRGAPWRIDFAADGTLSGVSGRKDEHTDRGNWWIDGDRLCRQWHRWSGGSARCYEIMEDGSDLRLFDSTGTFWTNAKLDARKRL